MKDNKNNLTRKTKAIFLIFILSGLIFCFAKAAKAQTEESDNLRILYQGEIKDAKGALVPDGKYNLKFTIYDEEATGRALWKEEHVFYNAVYVKDGKFKIILGRLTPLELNFNQPSFWLASNIGILDENNNINWEIETKPRKPIISLQELLKEKGLEQLQEGGLTDEEWKTIFSLIEEKLKIQPDLVVLFDNQQLKNFGETGTEASSKLFDVLSNLVTFISDRISQIFEEIYKIRVKIEGISAKLEAFNSILTDMKFKIDVLYKIFVEDKGLSPVQGPSETGYANKKTERVVFKSGETSLMVFDQSVRENSLIFISFSEDPGSSWWISEKTPGSSFNISLKTPAEKDLIFDYWILNEEEGAKEDSFQENPIIENPGQIEGEETSAKDIIIEEKTNEEVFQTTSTAENTENPAETILPLPEEQIPLTPENPSIPENPEG